MCSKDTEIDLLRDRVKEYRELLQVAHSIIFTGEKPTQKTLERFSERLDENGIPNTEEKGWPKASPPTSRDC